MFDHLFKPISVNGMILKNRIIATPTGDDFEEKAMGGAALVIAGHRGTWKIQFRKSGRAIPVC